MKRRTLIGLTAAGALALMLTPQLFSLVQPPDAGEGAEPPSMEDWAAANAPGEHQEHLKKMVGRYDVVNTYWMAPDTEPQVSKGTAVNRMIYDGRYLESEFEGEMEGQPFKGRGLTGYDNMAGKYVSVWIDSMSTGMMISEGQSEKGGTVFNYTSEMDMGEAMGGVTRFREVITIINDNSYKFEMFNPTPDGKEFKSMEIVYTRKK